MSAFHDLDRLSLFKLKMACQKILTCQWKFVGQFTLEHKIVEENKGNFVCVDENVALSKSSRGTLKTLTLKTVF